MTNNEIIVNNMRGMIFTLLFFSIFSLWGSNYAVFANDNKALYDSLEQVLQNRNTYIKKKNHTIQQLKSAVSIISDQTEKINLLYKISDMYYAYDYDSSMLYAKEMLKAAIASNNIQGTYKAQFQKSKLYASRGFYIQSQSILNKIDTSRLSDEILFLYYYRQLRLYSYWTNYYQDTEFYKEYSQKRNIYLRKCLSLIDKSSKGYLLLRAEYSNNILHNPTLSQQCYKEFLSMTNIQERQYGSAAYTLAQIYKDKGDMRLYEHYLLQSAINDQICCTKENVALQDLAMYLFNQNSEKNLTTAEKYIQISFSDALYYNNRLRIYEISRKLSTIVSAYEENNQQQYKFQKLLLVGITFLLIIAILSMIFIYIQNKKLTYQKQVGLRRNNQLTILNKQLHKLNYQLKDTNSKRESLAKLYIDLCSNYIDRFSKFQILVRRKIKANQINDLLSHMSSSRMSEEESSAFLTRFDKAFLNYYPTFVEEFDELLKPEAKQNIPQPNSLTMELRIFALIRLGVQSSGEIANLLFMSPQTIYNYRHRVKTSAINPETFESDVKKLCTVIKGNG